MKKLHLTKVETEFLLKYGHVDVLRNGLEISIEENLYFDSEKAESSTNERYIIYILNPYEKLVFHK